MAKFEPIEVIMRLSEARASDKGEICIQADKVQDLVRCRDCKYNLSGNCDNWSGWELVADDDFCSRGARMDEVEEEVLEVWDLDGSPTRYIKGERMDESTIGQVKVDVSINKPTERWDTCGLSENDILVDSGSRGERHDG